MINQIKIENEEYITNHDFYIFRGPEVCSLEGTINIINNSSLANIEYLVYNIAISEDSNYRFGDLLTYINSLREKSFYSKQIILTASSLVKMNQLPLIYITDSEGLHDWTEPRYISIGNFNTESGHALFIHELTHYIMYRLFDNETKPYKGEDSKLFEAYKVAFDQTIINFKAYIDSLPDKIKMSIWQRERLDTIYEESIQDPLSLFSRTYSEETKKDVLHIYKKAIEHYFYNTLLQEDQKTLVSRILNFVSSFKEHDEELIVLLPEFYSRDDMPVEALELVAPLKELYWDPYITPLLEE